MLPPPPEEPIASRIPAAAYAAARAIGRQAGCASRSAIGRCRRVAHIATIQAASLVQMLPSSPTTVISSAVRAWSSSGNLLRAPGDPQGTNSSDTKVGSRDSQPAKASHMPQPAS